MLAILERESWMVVYMASVDTKCEIFHSKFCYYFDVCFLQVKSRTFPNNTNWITPELFKKKDKITGYTFNYRWTKNPNLRVFIDNMNRNYKNFVLRSKQSYFKN